METIHLLKVPLAFYGLPSADPNRQAQLQTYIEQLKDALRPQASAALKAIDDNLREAIRAMPSVLYEIGDEFEIPVDCAAILFEHLYLVFRAYLEKPEAQLEELLLSAPEYAYHLLQENKRRREHGQPDLLAGDRDYEASLTKANPYWAIRWLQQDFSQSFFERILDQILRHKGYDAGAAHCYHYLCTQRLSPERRQEEMVKLLPVISTNPLFAFCVALEYPGIDSDPLAEAMLPGGPCWIYNWLRWVGRGNREPLLSALVQSAPWAAQYLHDVHPSDGLILLERARANCRNSWWLPWMDRFARQYRDHV